MYCLDRNHGYGTVEHYKGLKEYGPTPYHRISFDLHLNLIDSSSDEENE